MIAEGNLHDDITMLQGAEPPSRIELPPPGIA
jgi:hypothetical protein